MSISFLAYKTFICRKFTYFKILKTFVLFFLFACFFFFFVVFFFWGGGGGGLPR